jgi:hypothetical protein
MLRQEAKFDQFLDPARSIALHTQCLIVRVGIPVVGTAGGVGAFTEDSADIVVPLLVRLLSHIGLATGDLFVKLFFYIDMIRFA